MVQLFSLEKKLQSRNSLRDCQRVCLLSFSEFSMRLINDFLETGKKVVFEEVNKHEFLDQVIPGVFISEGVSIIPLLLFFGPNPYTHF